MLSLIESLSPTHSHNAVDPQNHIRFVRQNRHSVAIGQMAAGVAVVAVGGIVGCRHEAEGGLRGVEHGGLHALEHMLGRVRQGEETIASMPSPRRMLRRVVRMRCSSARPVRHRS